MDSRKDSYRWVVLGAGVFAQAASAAVLQGLPGLAPQLKRPDLPPLCGFPSTRVLGKPHRGQSKSSSRKDLRFLCWG